MFLTYGRILCEMRNAGLAKCSWVASITPVTRFLLNISFGIRPWYKSTSGRERRLLARLSIFVSLSYEGSM